MKSTLPGKIDDSNVTIHVIDTVNNEIVDVIYTKNKLVLRYHVVMTHLLSPVGNSLLQSVLSPSDFTKYGIPTSDDLKITQMKFGSDNTPTTIDMSSLISVIKPIYDENGILYTDTTRDYYDIDNYKFANGIAVNNVPDYDQAITFEALMAGPQGNSSTATNNVYREAGLFTRNGIMFARTTFPDIIKTENLAYRFSWQIRFP